jgi:beta-lactam-binding protein with PASTA domain
MENLKLKLLHWAKEIRFFVTSPIFLKNFGGILAVCIGTIGLVLLFLNIYTRHGSYITVPSFVGQTVEQGNALKGSKYLELVVIDSASYTDTLKFGEIVMQDPAPDVKAKKGRNIYVTINPYRKPTKRLPKLWDKQLSMAENLLSRTSFEWTVVRIPDRATNTVLEVKLIGKNGKKTTIERYSDDDKMAELPYGSKLELVVAEGAGAAVDIPSLVCMTYGEALNIIRDNNFSKGALMVSGSLSDSSSAYVWQQSPSAYDGLTINVGDPIDLWIQSSKPDGCYDDSEGE